MVDENIYGTDINSSWSVSVKGDLQSITGLNNAGQAILNRLLSRYNELSEFEYSNGYGNRSYEVVGETNHRTTENKLRVFIESCLKQEPRVQEIMDININFTGKQAIVDVSVKLINNTIISNLVFTLEES